MGLVVILPSNSFPKEGKCEIGLDDDKHEPENYVLEYIGGK